MAAVDLTPEALEPYLEPWSGQISIAAYNGPEVTIISGDKEAVEELRAQLRADGIRAQRASVPVAGHCHQIDEVSDRILAVLAPVAPLPGRLPHYSSAVGGLVDPATLGPAYWPRALREIAQFEQATRAVLGAGHRVLIEIGSHPVLSLALRQTLDAVGTGGAVLSSIGRRHAGPDRIEACVAEAWVHGVDVDWAGLLPGGQRRRIELPRGGEGEAGAEAATPRERVLAAPASGRGAMVVEIVRGHLAAALGLATPGEVPPTRSFKELGLDSAGAVELVERLNRQLATGLAPTAAFDHPTAAALAERLLADVLGVTPAGARRARPVVAATASDEPIAIVGIGCRLPGGVGSAADLWQLLEERRDAIGPFPEDRGWDLDRLADPDLERPGTCSIQTGGFLHDAPEFDAAFFGISPREALAMDPQQRVLLRIAWEALEDAGIDPHALRGSDTGVFAGLFGQEYGPRLHEADVTAGYSLTGMQPSVASGRVAYTFGFEGPAVSIDTACSSSLVAVHNACAALRQGECSLALAGGVTVLSTPGVLVEFTRQRGLAADGRCKAFGAGADGTGFSEGAGLLVLQRLSDAQRAGHHVLALIRGSAVNQDGASNGLTAPSGMAQEHVIRQALANARLSPADVDAAEAHGTGTVLGDPIEAGALIATYGQERADGPLRLGSLKSNIGHTNAAAGVAGVIKMVQALRHERLPQTLHCEEPSPHVDWEAGAVELLRAPVDWPAGERARRAAVSSFGISGTNAHVILEEAPRVEAAPAADGDGPGLADGALPFVVSAGSAEALGAQAGRLAAFLDARPERSSADVAAALATRRAALTHRAVVVAAERDELVAALRALERGEVAAVTGVADDTGPIAFLFSGQGAQWPGMGAELSATFPVFAAALDEVCAEFDQYLDRPLKQVMFAPAGSEDAQLLSHTRYTQTALFAFEVSLFRLVRGFGVEPSHLIGHSIGEFAAAHVAGVFSLPDACRVVAQRARLMGALPEGGAMLAVEATEEEARESLVALDAELSIAAVNGPRAVTISGEADAIAEVEALWRGRDRRTTRLDVSHAFHSALMEPMLADLEAVFAQVELSGPSIPIVSNLTGEPLTAEQACSPGYWVAHVRETVRFADGIRALRQAGVTRFLEVGPDGVLSALAAGIAADDATDLLFASAARGAKLPAREALLTFLGAAHCHGVTVDWSALFHGHTAGRVELPTYAFQGRRYWLTASAGAASETGGHPLLSTAQRVAGRDEWLLTGRLSRSTHPWLTDHAIGGTVLLPGTAFAELALVAARHAGMGHVEDLTLVAPLVLDGQDAVQVQVVVKEPGEDGRRELEIYARRDEQAGDADWVLHAAGALGRVSEPDAALADFAAASWPPADAEDVDLHGFYDRLAESDYNYGPAFQGLVRAFRRGDEWYAEVALPEEQHGGQAAGFRLHPALADAALHTMLLALADRGEPRVPFSFGGLRLDGEGCSALRVRVDLVDDGDAVGVLALDQHGAPAFAIETLQLRPADRAALEAQTSASDGSLYALEWTPVASGAAAGPPPRVALLGTGDLAVADLGLERYPDLAALEEVVASGAPAPEVLLAVTDGAPAADGIAAAAHETAARTLALLQARLRSAPLADTRVVLLTTGALAAAPGDRPNLAHAALVGLMRSAASENPGVFGLVDLDAEDAGAPAELLDALGHDEPELAIRGGRVLAPRLAAAVVEGDAQPAVDPDGTILITGGTGGLGALVARHLAAEHGARRLLLVSRRGAEAEGAAELVQELGRLGCEATVAACDVTDRAQLRELLAEIGSEHPLTAVFHAAGVLADSMVVSLDEERLRTAMAPKVDGALHLHELTADLGLSRFVLFSSAAATLGVAGQANYVAANAFLDALAHRRRADGLPATALGWGIWESTAGMASGGAVDFARVEQLGVVALTEGQGLALLDAALGTTQALLVPVRFERRALQAQARAGTLPAILRGLVRDTEARSQATDGTRTHRLAAAPESERAAIALELVLGHVAGVLRHGADEVIDPQRPFKDLGFDSLSAVELRNRLGQATGLRLPATLIYDYTSPAAVAELLRSKVTGAGPSAKATRRSSDRDEPIAIVGMSCRYPGGVGSPADLWELVLSGTDAIGEFPDDRGWDLANVYDPDPDHAGTSYTRHGGFIYDAGDFDPEFFSISPREALVIDPQHRLLLEGAWEALEDAGIDPTRLRGSATGVFAGVMYSDYGAAGLPPELEGYIGTAGSLLSGRLAYALGLEGPAVSIDTACSSSLVALHLAAQALRQGECDLALAGGSTVLATPAAFIQFSRQRALTPDGHSRPYAAGADGTAWSEGAGLLVLQRLSDAQRAGHRVLALVRGSAINQDGASNGLTAPNGPAQERVIRQALGAAGLSAADVDAVEGHGTGTALGDPIEAQALLATYGQERTDGPLHLGSLKSNIGHTQAAAGVAGVIKMVQALRHGLLPRSLRCEEPSPHVDWSAGDVELLASPADWSPSDRVRRAGVSSFGISGTNAHVILEEAPPVEVPPRGAEPPAIALVVSGRDEAALRAQAQRLRDWLVERPELEPVDVGFSLVAGRALLERRAVVVGADAQQLLAGLEAVASGETPAGVVAGQVRSNAGAVMVFPGQGSQWEGMALELLDAAPAFAASMRACGEALSAYVDWSLEDVLRGAPGAPSLERVEVVQPALFAVMVSLAALWRSYGVEPTAVIGHSQGEIAAAHVAGGLSLQDAARVVALRSQAIADQLAGHGGMASLALAPEAVAELIAPYGERLSLAAVNGPTSVVVSGEVAALDELVARCEADDVWARVIPVDYPSHSVRVEDLRERLARDLADIEPRSGTVPFFSTVTAELIDTAELDADYWYTNLRRPVRFNDALEALIDGGVGALIEVSPHPGLTVAMVETVERRDAGGRIAVIGSLRRDDGGLGRFLTSLGEAHVHGIAVDWSRLFDGGRRVDLPTYAFQRERYWLAAPKSGADLTATSVSTLDHPLLSAMLPLAGDRGTVFSGRVSLTAQPWLRDHAVVDRVLFPATAFVELLLAAGARLACGAIEELTLEAPLVLTEDDEVALEVLVGAEDASGRREVEVHSRTRVASGTDGDAEVGQWTRHLSGALTDEPRVRTGSPEPAWPPAGAEPVDVAAMYDHLADAGFGYGPVFQGVVAAWRRGEETFCDVALDEAVAPDAGTFGVHPALLDAAFHALLDGAERDGGGVPLPFALHGVRVLRPGATALRVALRPAAGEGAVALAAFDEAGQTVLEIDALALRPIDPRALNAAAQSDGEGLFRHTWVEVADDAVDARSQRRAVLGEELGDFGDAARHRDLDALVAAIGEEADAPDAVFATATDLTALLAFLQAWLRADAIGDARLVVVTHGAMAVTHGETPDPVRAALWGLVRSAQSEHPGRFTLLDLEAGVPSPDVDWPAALASDEPQLAVRGGTLLALRLVRLDGSSELTLPEGDASWCLDVPERGTLEGLTLVESPAADAPLRPHEVRIAMRVGGLNFRDVLIALGRYPDDDPIGSEGAGVVLETGADVTDLAVGDRVMGMMVNAFGPVAVADRRLVARMPAGWSFAQAATVPVAFLTAYYGLVDLAGLGAGERLLVHAGAGGVGMAAIGLARHLGAEVLATAGPDKWPVLRELGVEDERIASSRDLEFRDRLLAATGGEGVDVVLNALAGAAIDASLDLLPRGGHFIEMGKADRRDPDAIRRERPGVEYRSYDLLRDAGPDRIATMFDELLALFEAGTLRPLPVRAWDVRHAFAAFRHLGDGRNVGKVVLTIPRALDPDGTVLITGGTGDLGARVARHLAGEHGVGHLLLVSRSGEEAPGAAELVAQLGDLGAQARVVACDVADRDALVGLLDAVAPEHPLTAVIHTAGVLDDGLLESLTPERIQRVLAPKADAALLLDELTRDLDLAELVLFSSDSGTMGVPGQASYAAANVVLDALAQRRRAQGLPGVSMAWGLWSDATGMAGHLGAADIARLGRLGGAAMSNELELFDAGRAAAEPVVVPIALDLPALRAAARTGQLPPLMREIVRARPRPRAARAAVSLEQRLVGLAEADREQVVVEVIREEAAVVLGYDSPERIDAERKFKELGFDSLAGVELRNRLAAATGLRLPSTLVFDHPSPVAAAAFLLGKLGSSPAPASAPVGGAEDDAVRHALASISVDRLRAAGLLDQLLRIAGGDGATDGGDAERQAPDERPDLDALGADELVRLASGGTPAA
jgi:polyketide synthase 12